MAWTTIMIRVIVRQVGKAIGGRGVGVSAKEFAIILTDSAEVLQSLIDDCGTDGLLRCRRQVMAAWRSWFGCHGSILL